MTVLPAGDKPRPGAGKVRAIVWAGFAADRRTGPGPGTTCLLQVPIWLEPASHLSEDGRSLFLKRLTATCRLTAVSPEPTRPRRTAAMATGQLAPLVRYLR